MNVAEHTNNPVVNIALDTLGLEKQALVFVNTKRSAEKAAEEISKRVKDTDAYLETFSEDIRTVLSQPTRQCERLARCVKKGIAFHHAGLTSKQRELVESSFREGRIKIICSTPTLAAGLDLPAYRAIIKDLRRYTSRGLAWIPVLEYLQMCGRAGRPQFDHEGQAIAIASTAAEKKKIEEKYLEGEPEEIYSKLAVEPVLRTYVLSLIATGFVRTKDELVAFFSKTFYGHQFKDIRRITGFLGKVIDQLSEWEFILRSGGEDDFVDAASLDNETFRATLLGRRVAELYLDPLTAHGFISAMRSASDLKVSSFSIIQTICHTLELRPLLRVGIREHDAIQEELMTLAHELLMKEPSMYDPEYDEFLNSIKTAKMFMEWIDERGEEYLLENFNIRPGEVRAKLERADWLLYALTELCKIMEYNQLVKHIVRIRIRIKYGVREELLPLLRLKGVGRVRARTLYGNGLKDVGLIREAPLATLKQLLGKKIAESVHKQVGADEVDAEMSLRRWE